MDPTNPPPSSSSSSSSKSPSSAPAAGCPATSGVTAVISGDDPLRTVAPPAAGTETRTKVKPALKKHPKLVPGGSFDPHQDDDGDDDDDDDDDDEERQRKKKALKWDERVIEEHDQLRGTRMKIEEPNTPYTHYDQSGDGHESDDSSARHPKSPAEEQQYNKPDLAMHWDTLESKLESVAATRDRTPSSPSVSSLEGGSGHRSDEEEDEETRRKKEEEFKRRRKQHYNEMEALRKFRKEHPGGLLDDEEDEEENDADGDKKMEST